MRWAASWRALGLSLCVAQLCILSGSLLACDWKPSSTISSESSAEPADSSAEPAPPPQSTEAERRVREVKGTLQAELGGTSKSFDLARLLPPLGARELRSWDPYYGAWKNYVAVPLAALMKEVERAFSSDPRMAEVRALQFVATDGYSVELSRELVRHPAAFLAFGHAGTDGFEAIGEQGADPSPLYLVWEGRKYSDKKHYPRPWALSRIRFLLPADRFTHLAPPGGFGDDALAERGSRLFAGDCLRCHSINQEGGKLGPELNVPRSILSYRDESFVRAFIVNPASYRYSAMPAHPDLSEAELDALIAYLRLMGEHPHDPHQVEAP